MDKAPDSVPEKVRIAIDGTLLDSRMAHALTWSEAFAAGGFEIGFEKIYSLIGATNDQLLMNAIGIDVNESDGQILVTLQKELFIRNQLSKLRPFPGARELVVKILSEGLKVEIASSFDIYIIEKILERADVADLFPASMLQSHTVTLKPHQTVLVGATSHSIDHAKRENFRAIAFLCGGCNARELARAEAIYRDPIDLLHRFSSSILARTPRQKFTDSYFPLN